MVNIIAAAGSSYRPLLVKKTTPIPKKTGTMVIASNIFSNCVVRRKSLNKAQEVLKIKDFITKTSVLHYSVSWKLINIDLQNRQPIVLFSIPPHRSVQSRFGHLFGSSILSNMEQVHCSPYSSSSSTLPAEEAYSISGLSITKSGGTPYGPSHVANTNKKPLLKS